MLDLDALEAAVKAATKLPWEVINLAIDESYGVFFSIDVRDAAAIVALMNAAPELIAAARRERRMRKALRKLLTVSLPHDVSGERFVAEARQALEK